MVRKKLIFVLPVLILLNGCTTEYRISTPVYHPFIETSFTFFHPDVDKHNLAFWFVREYGYPFTYPRIDIRSRFPHQKLYIHEVSFIWENRKKYIIKNLNLKLSMTYGSDEIYNSGSSFYWDGFVLYRTMIPTTALFSGLGMKKPGRDIKYGISDEMTLPVTIVYSYEDGIVRTETDTFTVQCKKREAIEVPWFFGYLTG